MSRALLVRGARVRTFAGAGPVADALCARAGRIACVGAAADAEAAARAAAAAGEDVETYDAGGRVVTPGLIDAHVHLALAADRALELSLLGTASRGAALARVAAAHATLPPGEWLLGAGQREADWREPADRAALDAVVGDRPALFASYDAHAAWVSTAALAAAGVTRETPDPAGGRIGRDATGAPDGRLFENAVGLVRAVVPPGDARRRERAVEAVLRRAARRGVTAVHDFEGTDAWRLLAALRDAGGLPLRVAFGFFLGELGAVRGRAEDVPGDPEIAAVEDDRLRAFALKGVLDGALSSRTAHLLAPYEDDPGRGLATLGGAQVAALGAAARARGWSLALHAIGDAATRAALDAFAAWPAADRRRLRPRVEHAQLVAPGDIARFAALGVVASMQPAHCVADRPLARARWGARDDLGGYAWRALRDAGALLAFGSDAPIEPLDPPAGLAAAVTGGDPVAHAAGRTPARALTLDEAFAAYTVNAAWAARDEARMGRIARGMLADFVVWEEDPWALPGDRLAELQAAATFVGGVTVV